MKTIKILFISDIYPPYIKGGAEISTSLIIQNLNKEEYTTTLLTSRVITDLPDKENGVQYKKKLIIPFLFEEVNKPYIFRFVPNLSYHIYNFIYTFLLILRNNYDLIHCVPLSYATLPTLIAALIMSKPLVVDVRGYLFTPNYLRFENTTIKTPFYKKIGNLYQNFCYFIFLRIIKFLLVYKKNVNIIALSKHMQSILIAEGFPSNKIQVIYNISQKINKPTNNNRRKNGIVFAGVLEETKGIWDAIKGFEKIENSKIIFHILGEGSQFSKIQQYISKKNIQNIILHGKVDNDTVIEFYQQNRVILAPSVWPEPFGRFIQEASITRTPIITTNTGGIGEYIKDKITGLIVQPGHPSQITLAIKLLLEDNNLYYEISNNLERMAYNFSPEYIIPQRKRIYQELINNK